MDFIFDRWVFTIDIFGRESYSDSLTPGNDLKLTLLETKFDRLLPSVILSAAFEGSIFLSEFWSILVGVWSVFPLSNFYSSCATIPVLFSIISNSSYMILVRNFGWRNCKICFSSFYFSSLIYWFFLFNYSSCLCWSYCCFFHIWA